MLDSDYMPDVKYGKPEEDLVYVTNVFPDSDDRADANAVAGRNIAL